LESEKLAPIAERFAEEQEVATGLDCRGSVDIIRALEEGAGEYDPVCPANSM